MEEPVGGDQLQAGTAGEVLLELLGHLEPGTVRTLIMGLLTGSAGAPT